MRSGVRNCTLEPLLGDSCESHYWGGFLLADGSYNGRQIVLELSEKDRSHVHRFARFLNHRDPDSVGNRLAVMHNEFAGRVVEKHGLVSRKTYNPSIPEGLNDEQFLARLIGFIDGDGHIAKGRDNACGTIQIECHRAWKPVLDRWMSRVQAMAGAVNRETRPRKSKGGTCVRFLLGEAKVVRMLGLAARRQALPVLGRKWSVLDLVTRSNREIAAELRPQACRLRDEGFSSYEIGPLLGIPPARVRMYWRDERLSRVA